VPNSAWYGDEREATSFVGADFSISENTVKHYRYGSRDRSVIPASVASKWHNRRPICPYGCGEEGELVEIIVKPGDITATGVYRDSEQLVFTAPMKMMPKPATRKLVRGPDGELHETTQESQ
jgi:hypothetical protein